MPLAKPDIIPRAGPQARAFLRAADARYRLMQMLGMSRPLDRRNMPPQSKLFDQGNFIDSALGFRRLDRQFAF